MTLKELLRKNSWLSVKKVLYRCYPDEELNDEGYEAVYDKLRQMEARDSFMWIVLKRVNDDSFCDEPYVDVSGRVWHEESGRFESYAIEFKPWNEWLGMNVDNFAFGEFSETEIIAHCLFEMTFVGFDQKQIQQRYEEIISIADEIKAITEGEKEGKLIPWEKIKKELGI